MKDTVIALPCCLYHSATRLRMQSTDEKLNCVYKLGERVSEAAFAVLIKEKYPSHSVATLPGFQNQFKVWINTHLMCM